MEIVKRYRVNVSTSVKGVKTYDCTVDFEGDDDYCSVLKASDELVAELDKRYPPEASLPKEK
jgi:hypothetical protein